VEHWKMLFDFESINYLEYELWWCTFIFFRYSLTSTGCVLAERLLLKENSELKTDRPNIDMFTIIQDKPSQPNTSGEVAVTSSTDDSTSIVIQLDDYSNSEMDKKQDHDEFSSSLQNTDNNHKR